MRISLPGSDPAGSHPTGTARFTEMGILLIYVCCWDVLTTFEEASVPFCILLFCLPQHLLGPSPLALLFSLPFVFHHVLWFYLLVYFWFCSTFSGGCVLFTLKPASVSVTK